MDQMLSQQSDADQPAREPRRAVAAPAQPSPDTVYLAAKVIRRRIRLALLASRLEATLRRS